MKKNFTLWIAVLLAVVVSAPMHAQGTPPEALTNISQYLTKVAQNEVQVDAITIDSVSTEPRTLQLFVNINASYVPYREELVKDIYEDVLSMLPEGWRDHRVQIITDGKAIEDLIPMALRSKVDRKAITFATKVKYPLVKRLSVPYSPKAGLTNKHIAVWQSHGYYFEPQSERWEWQRARIFQTVEDLFTQSFVLPYLVPMLENAGANVLIPRERDVQTHEIIVDNDGCLNASTYSENNGVQAWTAAPHAGFAHRQAVYSQLHNPFTDGTARMIRTIKKGKESVAEWRPEIPETGYYAVYVSYQSLPNSAPDATYTVHHKGGTTQFSVNQQMGGGTWVYLGSFMFDAGISDKNKVVLSNKTAKEGQSLTADAIKIGGGLGNIARGVEGKSEQVSGYPRFTEASRYWLQWAGMPDSVYSESHGVNDYTDDYRSRGAWVNYMAGGSPLLPQVEGLHIPIDLALAFHSDAGTTLNDSIIGTLGIYMTHTNRGVYANGASRYLARDLTDLIQTHIVNDIRQLYEPEWTRRGMWNKSYFEARVPQVPTMLLELLSHQNFADMRYGLDPRFRFTVARSIYKGMLQFIASQYRQAYVVQPLPVDHLALLPAPKNMVELSWQPVDDPLEPTAKATHYVVYTRTGSGAFDNGIVVEENKYRTTIPVGQVVSFKVTALNEGGESFPSEILSVGRAEQEKGVVMVVNAFDRISAPADFVGADIAGFLDKNDYGVPDKMDISYIGSMKEFRRAIPWTDDDSAGFGDSYANYETMVIAGNTFDYPAVHGEAILKAGYSFYSASDEVVESNAIRLADYTAVDLICGKERQVKMGRGGVTIPAFKIFSIDLQNRLAEYCQAKGNVLISGAFVGSDIWDNLFANPVDKQFATDVLKYKWRVGMAAIEGHVKSVPSPLSVYNGELSFFNTPNPNGYVVEAPDAIEPVDDQGSTILRYSENNLSAGVAYKGAYKTLILGFPFESIVNATERESLMNGILQFFRHE